MIPPIFLDPRIILMIIIALVFALFDTFNKRNIPNIIVYTSFAIAIIVTLTYGLTTIMYSLPIAVVLSIFSYILYKSGQLGAGDGFEFVIISLLLPFQPAPAITTLSTFFQINLPFIISVFVNAGILTLIFVPIYYLLILKDTLANHPKFQNYHKINAGDAVRALSVLIMYILFYFIISYFININIFGIVIILLISVPSSIILLYNKKINLAMISLISPSNLENGDIIAINLMDKKDIDYFKKLYKNFGRLATTKQIKNIKKSNKKIPVYKNAVPLSLPIFFGILISLLIGNLLLFML
jgi:Flp pilus assembly protein protease CpaA